MRKSGWLAVLLLPAMQLAFAQPVPQAQPQVQSSALTGCAAKKNDIETQLAQARAAGNAAQVSGLEKALKEAQAHCSDAGLKQQREKKLGLAKQKVAEREASLEKARQGGKQKKIEKQQRKLDEARQEQKEAEQELLK